MKLRKERRPKTSSSIVIQSVTAAVPKREWKVNRWEFIGNDLVDGWNQMTFQRPSGTSVEWEDKGK